MSFHDGVHALVVGPGEPAGADFPDWSPEDTLLRAWLDSGQALVVDLRGIAQVHSRFLGFLVRLKTLLAQRGGRLVLLVDDEGVQETIKLLGLERVFAVAGDWDDALQVCRLQEGAWLDEVGPCLPSSIHDEP